MNTTKRPRLYVPLFLLISPVACATATPVELAGAGSSAKHPASVIAPTSAPRDELEEYEDFGTTLLFLESPTCHILSVDMPSGCLTSGRCHGMGCCAITAVAPRLVPGPVPGATNLTDAAPPAASIQHVAYWVGVGHCERPKPSELIATAKAISTTLAR
jgi:hypothetical protein